jgi:AAA+ superfamily predicted ATPase
MSAGGAPFGEQLIQAIRAGWPLVAMCGGEESVTLAVLGRAAKALGMRCAWWSATSGLTPLERYTPGAHLPWRRGDDMAGEALASGLKAALEAIADDDSPQVFALLDPQPWLNDPWVVRALRELTVTVARRRQVIALCGDGLLVPDALRREVVTLDVPLPDRGALRAVLDGALPEAELRVLPRERLVGAALGLTRQEALRAYRRARLVYEERGRPLSFRWDAEVLAEKRRVIGQGEVVEFVEVKEGLGEVGGLEELKGWLETRREAFGEEARRFGLPSPKGLLLVGVQGCGKSLAGKAVAHHWGLPLLRLDLGSVFGGHLPPDAALHAALRVAKAVAPCVLWVDEVEKGFGAGADGVTRRVLGSLLTWLQEKEEEVFFVATANEVGELPPELLRKGRFDELFFVDLPDKRAREQIIAIHLRKRARDPAAFNLTELAALTEHWSGAELEQLVVSGLYEAFAEARALSQADLTAAASMIVPLYRTREDEIKRLREWASSRARFAGRDRTVLGFFGGAA